MAIVRNGRKLAKRTQQTPTLELNIDSLSHEAHGVARHEGKVVFVPGALANEHVRVKLQKQQRHFSQAQLLQVLTPSEDRVTPECAHYERCGACQLQHLNTLAQLPYKQENLNQQLLRQLKLASVPWQTPITSEGFGYRRRARLGVRYRKQHDEVIVGFREEANSHLASVETCSVLEPQLSALIKPMTACLNSLQSKGVITQAELIACQQGAVVVLRHIKAINNDDQSRLKQFAQQHNCLLYLEGNEHIQCVYPEQEPALSYSVDGYELEFQVKDFIQGNGAINQAMVQTAAKWLDLKPNETLLDLFAGIGNFSLPLAKQVKQLYAVEGVKEMVTRINHNAQKHQITNIEATALNLADEELLFRLPKADAILLDPPRTGAAPLMPWLSQQKSRILYVACEPSSLVRDAKPLLEAGFRIEKISVMDMFPQTKHVETMALFVKD
ncbi:23S rRNA (uracil(1939)-C(5))-methyltransferase RlmD [Oceaniserpentilla sp. 4NH20-0058]|uniref:23S rRNA (uracil(1939)-C(5))-methyltransferase RlmD n=1 Tax=Oceaniserpentilla sp. 4NH20-0058 TaxID=3127660 RepID=UPI003104BD80